MADQSNEMGVIERVAAALEPIIDTIPMISASPDVVRKIRAGQMARAAIEAMREPTKAMAETFRYHHDFREGWLAALDAALSHDEVKG